jgi:alkyl hydroperoxide reductase subunit AhpF
MELPQFILDTSSLAHANPPDQNTLYDMLILGGGPAAMSAAIYAARKLLNIEVITIDFGGQIRETWEVENYLGFQNISAKDLAGLLPDIDFAHAILKAIGKQSDIHFDFKGV